MSLAPFAVYAIAAAATGGVILRPFGWPEAIWAVAGAALLVALGLLPPGQALAGIGDGLDVYLFLTGMMLLAELAREERLFEWLAAVATRAARGSASRLFLLVYGVGILVTMFLSNDATAVVLTPAVAASVRTARVERPLPYLLACAFIANAASFLLPISNPANLVIYGRSMPPLADWLSLYLPAALAAILATFLALRWTQRGALAAPIAGDVPVPDLPRGGRMAALGIAATAAALTAASARGWPLGFSTFVAGMATTMLVLLCERRSPMRIVRQVSWSVLVLVAGLFVLVRALDRAGLIEALARLVQEFAAHSAAGAAWSAGIGAGLASNLMNNLPVGLISGGVVRSAHAAAGVTGAILAGVDLGPNLSVTGSLATILWLIALRREGHAMPAWDFLRIGLVTMPPALLAALALILWRG